MNALEFERRIERIPESGCWIWQIVDSGTGYGCIFVNGGKKKIRAHRIAWELFRGPIPEGIFVCHHCDVRCCVNPDHLFLGTNSDNILDAYRKGRMRSPNPPKTHCLRGHAYDRISKRGAHICYTCSNAQQRAAYARAKAKARGESV